jgi:putative peptidoglycan lipid II flippase
MLFFSLASISQSILNSFGDFILPGLRQTTLNLSLILMIVLGTASLGVYALAIGFLVGSASQLFIQFPSLIKRIRYYFKISLADEATKCFFFLFLPLLLGMVINQLNILVDKIVASLLGPGNVSALNYAERMMEMTKSVLGVAVATVIFPHLSIASYKKDLEDFIQPLKKGINLLFFTTFPITLSFLFFTSPIIEILFKRGLFGDTSLTLTSQALFYYAFAAFFITINYVLIRAFYALRKVKLTVIATTFCLIINIVLNLTLSRVMGVGGITAATSISNGLLFFLLMYLLDKEVGLEIRSWLLRVVIIGMTQLIAFGLGFCIYNVLAGFENLLMIRLSVVAIIILASLCLLSWLFKIEEFNWIVSLIRRKTQG